MGLTELSQVAKKLVGLQERFAFVGGCVLPLLLDATYRPSARSTFDVDVIVGVVSRTAESGLDERLRALGFHHDIRANAPRCRWILEGMTVDVMAQGPGLEFATAWLVDGLAAAVDLELSPGVHARVITPPYFMAAKIQAFRDRGTTRGRPDYYGSKDLEDVIALVEGRTTLVSELEHANPRVQQYVVSEITRLLRDQSFIDALPAHLSDMTGTVRHDAQKRVVDILFRIGQIGR